MSIYRIRPAGAALACLALTVLLAACSTSPTVQFYSLSSSNSSSTGTPLDLALAIGPAQFPRGLARSQIVTRADGNRIKVDEYHVWNAPLEYEFLRVLGDNVAGELQANRVSVYPSEAAFPVDYRITLEIIQFDGVPGDSVTLRARWAIAPAKGAAVAVGTFEETRPTRSAPNDDDYNALVAAHSTLIGDLGAIISEELRKLAPPPPG